MHNEEAIVVEAEAEVRGHLKALASVAVLQGEAEVGTAQEGEEEEVIRAQRVEVDVVRDSGVVEVEAQILEVEDVLEALISEEVPVVEDGEDLQDRSSSSLALYLPLTLD